MRKMRSDEEVTLNLASMLDMAFQLLAFFILTFQPPAAESQIMMRMPPPLAVIGAGKVAAGQDESKDPNDVKPAKTLLITVADKDGEIDFLQVGVPSIAPPAQIDFPKLNDTLTQYFKGSGDAFEQVIINGTGTLRWGELMRVVEICANQRFSDGKPLSKLSFSLVAGPGDK
ncbi:MAG: biopolymer transporter ExbD [Thermoguttaceae bacterium]|jgi:biopolymer transport protein ExbD